MECSVHHAGPCGRDRHVDGWCTIATLPGSDAQCSIPMDSRSTPPPLLFAASPCCHLVLENCLPSSAGTRAPPPPPPRAQTRARAHKFTRAYFLGFSDPLCMAWSAFTTLCPDSRAQWRPMLQETSAICRCCSHAWTVLGVGSSDGVLHRESSCPCMPRCSPASRHCS